jgi:hypothetical protein
LARVRLDLFFRVLPTSISRVDDGPLNGIVEDLFDFFLMVLRGEVIIGVKDHGKVCISLEELC